jgi:hypothetical protein
MGLVSVEAPIDINQGLRLIHYACYFGKIKPLKALVEQFNADIMAIDYRGQTPLHVATSSGELGATLYLSSSLDLFEGARESKDNALMTPLMNTVSTNNLPSFVYLFFKEHCHLNHVDI